MSKDWQKEELENLKKEILAKVNNYVNVLKHHPDGERTITTDQDKAIKAYGMLTEVLAVVLKEIKMIELDKVRN